MTTPEPDTTKINVTVPLSYVEMILDGESVGPRTSRDKTLHWWGLNETCSPQYVGRALTTAEAIAHRHIQMWLEAVSEGRYP